MVLIAFDVVANSVYLIEMDKNGGYKWFLQGMSENVFLKTIAAPTYSTEFGVHLLGLTRSPITTFNYSLSILKMFQQSPAIFKILQS